MSDQNMTILVLAVVVLGGLALFGRRRERRLALTARAKAVDEETPTETPTETPVGTPPETNFDIIPPPDAEAGG